MVVRIRVTEFENGFGCMISSPNYPARYFATSIFEKLEKTTLSAYAIYATRDNYNRLNERAIADLLPADTPKDKIRKRCIEELRILLEQDPLFIRKELSIEIGKYVPQKLFSCSSFDLIENPSVFEC